MLDFICGQILTKTYTRNRFISLKNILSIDFDVRVLTICENLFHLTHSKIE